MYIFYIKLYGLEIRIPEKEATQIISTYVGANNYILDLKQKIQSKYYKLGRTQVDYTLTNCNTIPKIARKYTQIDPYFSEQLQEKRLLPVPPTTIWVEKILVETPKAYHIWGKIIDSDELYAFWVPKSQIVPTNSRKIEIDYSPFSTRPPMDHQRPAIENLLKMIYISLQMIWG